ncbi:MAG: DUF5667 domain-containing protein, partial [Candidatus Nanoarchaeia archaeon]
MKKGLFLLSVLVFGILFLSVGIVIAQENDSEVKGEEELKCLPCGDGCGTVEFVSAAFCQPPTNGEPICGVENGECVVLGFEDNLDSEDGPICGDGICEEAEKFCSSSFVDDEIGVATSDCGPDYCPADCGEVLESPIDEPEFDDAELEADEGITPDSALYFLDEFFDRFGDDLEIREERIAEIRAMVEEGNFEAARDALESYKKIAEKLEREVDPSQRDEALRSAAAIRNAMQDIQENIPPEERDEFVRDVVERERLIATSAEIASKIKELCETLSELDPLEYSRVCRTDDNSPGWHQRLDDDLTAEQRQEAEEFFEIMSECFQTSGAQCRCEDIGFTDFANSCSIMAPLAYACDVEEDESACDELDRIEDEEDPFDLLPDYLQDVLDAVEDRYEDSQYDNHIPRECREAGITGDERGDRQRCSRIMIETGAPEECKEELIASGCDSERECRGICERIMFELDAPEECIEAGVTDHRECAIIVFRENAAPECLDAGLTGEHRSDWDECRRIAGDFDDRRGPGPGFGANC